MIMFKGGESDRQKLTKGSEMEKIEMTVEQAQERALGTQLMLLGYVRAVGERIGWGEALKILGEVMGGFRTMWVSQNLPNLGITGTDARAGLALIRAAASMVVPWVKPEDERVVEDTPERGVSQRRHWCPTLEACKMLNLSPKDVCPNMGVDAFLKALNPKLSAQFGKLRPEADYCEEIIVLEK